jgi:hypothetical protein
MSRQLTTAETLVLEVLVAHKLLGAQHSTLDRRLWIKPQLETLREFGLVTWTYDENANFLVTATDRLMSASEAIAIADGFRDEVLTTSDAHSVPGHRAPGQGGTAGGPARAESGTRASRIGG